MAPVAPTAQREGISQATCSTPGELKILNSTPVKTTWTIANITSSGIVFSAVFTSEEMIRPNIIEVKPRAMIAQADLHGTGMRSRPLRAARAVEKPMAQMITPWRAVMTPRTMTFDIRYADRDRPVARSRS